MISRPLALVRHAVRTPTLLGVAALLLANSALMIAGLAGLEAVRRRKRQGSVR